MHETLISPRTNEQLLADIHLQHGDAIISMHGLQASLNDMTVLRKGAKCDRDLNGLDELAATKELEILVPILQESGVELTTDYEVFRPREANKATLPNKPEKDAKSKNKVEETTVVEAKTINRSVKPAPQAAEAELLHNERIVVSVSLPERLAQVMARTVVLEPLKLPERVIEIPQHRAVQIIVAKELSKPIVKLTEHRAVQPTLSNEVSQPIVAKIKKAGAPEKPKQDIAIQPAIIAQEVAPLFALTHEPETVAVMPDVLPKVPTELIDITRETVTEDLFEDSENSLVMTSEAGLTAADPIEFIVPARHEVVADALDSEQVEFVEQSEVFDETPEPLTETEQMVAVVQGFFEQAAPLISEQILEIIAELPPEESAEIVAQIELLVVVADRLHQLIIEGNETGEEALQIEAFLTREYEQLLVKVGVEPTPEIIAQFMRYIHSDSYNFASAMPVARTEIEDEGTHEKKLFDEAGVFFKAQQASVVWKQNLQTMIGRVSVNNLAA